MSGKTMKVILCEPGRLAREAEIGTDLESMQQVVGGLIQAIYPFEDPAAIVCNDEGKLIGLPLNRALRDPEGKPYDAIAGTFFICGLGEEDFCSLSPEQLEKYAEMYRHPEQFYRTADGVAAIPYTPNRDDHER